MDAVQEVIEDAGDAIQNSLPFNDTSDPDLDMEENELEHMFDHADRANGRSCKKILYASVFGGGLRAWDLLILIPTAAFLLFLVLRFRHARQKLGATNSPIFRAFYALVFVAASVGVVRSLVSMTVSVADPLGSEADKTLWILLRFILLSTEMSVLIFGLAAGHLESRASVIRRVVIATAVISGLFSFVQAVLEFGYPDPDFRVNIKSPDEGGSSSSIDLYGHGGSVFWLVSSLGFDGVYVFVLLLPVLPCRHSLTIPHKRSFYGYAAYILLIHLVDTLGAALLVGGGASGVCFINLGSYLYFTTFAPVVYFTFLQGFFRVAQPTLLFSYKSQVDEFEDDVVPQGGSLEFTDAEQNNTPIVLNSSALFHQHSNGPEHASANGGMQTT